MTELEILTSRLRRVAFWLRVRAGLRGALAGLLAGAIGAGLLIGLSRIVTLPRAPLWAAAFAATALVAGFLVRALRRVPLARAAILADRASGTHELLSTAVESAPGAAFTDVNLKRAAVAVATVHPARAARAERIRPRWFHLAAPVAAAAMLFLPPLSTAKPSGSETAALPPAIVKELERDVRDLKRAAKETENRDLEDLAKDLQKLVNDVKKGELTRKDAMAKLAALQERAEEIKKQMEDRKKALAKMGENSQTKKMADAAGKGDTDAAKKEAEELAKKMADGTLDKKKMKEMLDKMARESGSDPELADAAKKASEALEKGDVKEFARQMKRLSERLNGAKSGDLRDGELAEGEFEIDETLEDLEEAEEELAESGKPPGEKSIAKEFCPDCGKKKKPDGT